MDQFADYSQENIDFEINFEEIFLYEQGDVDPNTFDKFIETEEYVDHRYLFTTNRISNSKVELVDWAKETAMKANTYLIINRYQRSRTADRRPYVTLACERGGAVKKTTKPVVDDEEEEVLIKRRGPYGTKKCGCPFKLKGEQMATSDSWQLFVHDGRHNHKIGVYHHGHAQAARLTEEQLKQTEQFRKSHVPPHNILQFFNNKTLVKIYSVVAKIKKNRMQGRNTVEEVLCLSAKWGYMVFYRNCDESNVLSNIVIAHPTSIAMIRTWPYVLIMHTTYKMNKYNMPLLEAVGMTPTGKNFTVVTAFMRNEQGSTYKWVL
ncbi:hypothetical protein M9H77_19006 [Catharanthus roseus]|uniref:Uncharacterized protein n=1 Tax=Catharanthus roseus TaxID=4058 RepID=A0ACC0B953_CATRO|nr:hypothetical protein M9H77_19006 [Catharanthus roseus]